MQDTTDDVEEKVGAFEIMLRGLMLLSLITSVGLGVVVALIMVRGAERQQQNYSA